MFGRFLPWCLGTALVFQSLPSAYAIDLDTNSTASIKAAAKIVAADLWNYYIGYEPGQIPGMLPYPPYYWWESGAMWGALIDYWYYTGDDTYNADAIIGLQFQRGTQNDYEPLNETSQLGNDDQGFWGMAVMAAAEYGFPNPPDTDPSWLSLAQAVFNTEVSRWDTATCGGGLRWQIFIAESGYDYKNSISNGCMFNIAARLGKYTSNTTYLEWAAKVFEWELDVGLISPSNDYAVYDGTTPSENCTSLDHYQWTYTVGIHLLGAAVMWNVTGDDIWKERTSGLLNATATFFREDLNNSSPYIMYESECEVDDKCDTDAVSYKAYLSRWMSASVTVAPWTYDYVMERLRPSAEAAALVCSGGTNNTQCGFKWYTGVYDGSIGPGQQMCALETIQGLLASAETALKTSTTGGNSSSDTSAGTDTTTTIDYGLATITTKDRAGAWIITVIFAICTLGGGAWMLF